MNSSKCWTDPFKLLYKERAKSATQWKEQGGWTAGYIYSHVPKELLYAAGILPVQMLEDTSSVVKVLRCLPQFFCYQGLGNLELAMKGDYDYLDGVVMSHSCDPLRKLFGVWVNNIPMKFSYFLPLPLKGEPAAWDYFKEELSLFKEAIESFVGKKITDEDIRKSIEIFNRNRDLVKNLYELRKSKNPPVKGSEIMDVLRSAVVTDRDVHSNLLESLLQELSSRPADAANGKGKRMFVSTISLNDKPFMELIEELGGDVVIDDLANGARYYWNKVECAPNQDPLDALSRRYAGVIPFAGRFPGEKRADLLIDLCKTYDVKGAIFKTERYCDPYDFETPYIRQRFKEAGIPVLTLDFVNIHAEGGRVRTRVQAFLETL
jgi:benzoyl-CoA reductase subunit C